MLRTAELRLAANAKEVNARRHQFAWFIVAEAALRAVRRFADTLSGPQ